MSHGAVSAQGEDGPITDDYSWLAPGPVQADRRGREEAPLLRGLFVVPGEPFTSFRLYSSENPRRWGPAGRASSLTRAHQPRTMDV